jgi:hypothetical protein
MGNYTQQKGSSSDKDDNKDAAQYVKFEIPLNIAEPNGDKYDRKVKIFNNGKAFKWCEFRETTDELFDTFGCKAETTNDANRRHHLYIALFSGRAKEIYRVPTVPWSIKAERDFRLLSFVTWTLIFLPILTVLRALVEAVQFRHSVLAWIIGYSLTRSSSFQFNLLYESLTIAF